MTTIIALAAALAFLFGMPAASATHHQPGIVSPADVILPEP
jgi:hypothetical protein